MESLACLQEGRHAGINRRCLGPIDQCLIHLVLPRRLPRLAIGPGQSGERLEMVESRASRALPRQRIHKFVPCSYAANADDDEVETV
jgi:hypothetical protein